MFKLIRVVCLACILISCNAQPTSKKQAAGVQKNVATKMQGGKDFVHLKRYRVEDKQGFNQPLEVSSFLLPANWQVTSNVQWNPLNKCLPGMVQVSVHATAPDGDYELFYYPVTQFDWSDDPIQLDAMKRGFYAHACIIAPPLDAAGYISRELAPYLKAQVKSSGIIQQLQQQMDAGAHQMTMQARSAGNNAYSHRGSAAQGVLQFADGKEGLAFCTLMQTIVTMPGTQGGMANNIQSYVSMRLVFKYKPANREMARKILSTFFSSSRINPQWMGGVQALYAAVTSNAQSELWKQIQISHQAQEEIGNNIIRSWEAKNKTTDAVAAANSDGFGQYLRGVENWTDADGNKVELTSGYSNAWSKGDGSYMLSNNPAFDPNVELGGTQSWGRMKQ